MMLFPSLRLSLCLGLGLAVLGGCTANLQEPKAKDIAQCLAKSMNDSQAQELGLQGSQLKVGRGAGWGCSATWDLATSELARETVASHLKPLLQQRLAYRKGRYSALADERLPVKTRERVGDIALLLEDVVSTRRGVLACGAADEASVQVVAQLDATFLLASLGRHAGYPTLQAAQAVVDPLTAAIAASVEAQPQPACDDQLTKRFRSQVEQWRQFYAGEHAWAPGCSVSTEDAAFVLKCKGPAEPPKN